MYEGFWKDFLLNNLYIPVLIAILGIVLRIVQQYADKFVELFNKRQKIESMEKIATVRDKLVMELDKNVQAAVASNIDMADKMKAAGHKLDEGQIREINESAKVIIMKSLPSDINGMTPAEILGGEHVMNSMIDSFMEKHVLEYKIKRAAAKGETIQIVEQTQDLIINDRPMDEPPVQDLESDGTIIYDEPILPEYLEEETKGQEEEFQYADDVPEQEYVEIGEQEPEQPAKTSMPIVIERPFFNNTTFNGVG